MNHDINYMAGLAVGAIFRIENSTDRDVNAFSFDPSTGKIEIVFEPRTDAEVPGKEEREHGQAD